MRGCGWNNKVKYTHDVNIPFFYRVLPPVCFTAIIGSDDLRRVQIDGIDRATGPPDRHGAIVVNDIHIS